MESRPEKTLVVETGILCNNHCVFCYQNGYRRVPGFQKLVPIGDVLDRIDWGAANGYDDLSLTGGEPTIRRDFLDIVSHARAVGYRHVAVTTNGSRLCDAGFFRKALEAGLDGMGVSIHGISSGIHDGLTGRAGSFQDAVLAVRNGARAAEKLGGHRFRMNTFTVIHQGNVGALAALTDMLAGLGARLMILQPPITGKSNVTPMAAVSLDDLVHAVSDAARAAIRGGYLIKPFNIPPCMFPDMSQGLDLTMYSRSTFRENDDTGPGSRSRGEHVGFVSLPVCGECRCRDFCEGLSLTLMPMADLMSPMLSIVRSHAGLGQAGNGATGPLWLTGTELLDRKSICELVRVAGPRQVNVCTGGTHRIGPALFDAIVAAGPNAGLALVHQPRDPGSSDRILCSQGNDTHILEFFRELTLSGLKPRLVVCGAPEPGFLGLLGKLADGGLAAFCPEIRLAPPWRLDVSAAAVVDFVDFARDTLGAGSRVVVGSDGVRESAPGGMGARVAEVAAIPGLVVDLEMDVPATPFDNPLWSVLNWSGLQWFVVQAPPAAGLVAESVVVRPLR